MAPKCGAAMISFLNRLIASSLPAQKTLHNWCRKSLNSIDLLKANLAPQNQVVVGRLALSPSTKPMERRSNRLDLTDAPHNRVYPILGNAANAREPFLAKGRSRAVDRRTRILPLRQKQNSSHPDSVVISVAT